IGSSVVIALHAAGVGLIDCVDPQRIEPEQLGPFVHIRESDIGLPKSVALARFLNQRRVGIVRGICGGIEHASVEWIRRSSLVICCANNIVARLGAEQKTILAGVPILQVAAFDGREQFGGMITIKHPSMPHLACYGCIAPMNAPARDGLDGLVTPVTAVLGNLAAEIATLILAERR